MFDLALQVRLKQARNALQDGRLDEAFAIAADRKIRELRGGQVLLEDLVRPLLDRAAQHLAAGRLKDALMDAERAIEAGGNRSESLELRQKVEAALAEERSVKRRDVELIESARRHVRDGSLWTVKEMLKEASPGLSEAERLRREAESRELRAERAAARAREALDRGEVVEALVAAAEAVDASRRHEALSALLFDLKNAAAARIEETFDEGQVGVAADVLSRLRAVAAESLEVRKLEEILTLALKAQSAFRAADYGALRILLGKLRKLAPRAAWVAEGIASVQALDTSLDALRMGPLGCADGSPPRDASRTEGLARALTMPARNGEGPVRNGEDECAPELRRSPAVPGGSPEASSKLLLWVDGVGTYLVLTSPRVTLGRAGSSARPDIPLAADIAGVAAEVVRIEDDYFVVGSQGSIRVGGHPTDRKLLSGGDEIELGARCKLRFELPTPLSSTAILALPRGQRIQGDVRKVVLLKEHLILGPKGRSHIEAVAASKKVVISRESRGIVCRAEEDIRVGDRSHGREAVLPLGARVQVGDVTFTLTEWV